VIVDHFEHLSNGKTQHSFAVLISNSLDMAAEVEKSIIQ
jgi:hypothetical protein